MSAPFIIFTFYFLTTRNVFCIVLNTAVTYSSVYNFFPEKKYLNLSFMYKNNNPIQAVDKTAATSKKCSKSHPDYKTGFTVRANG